MRLPGIEVKQTVRYSKSSVTSKHQNLITVPVVFIYTKYLAGSRYGNSWQTTR